MKRFIYSSCLVYLFLCFIPTNFVLADVVSADLLLSAEQETVQMEEIILEHIENALELNTKPTAKLKKIEYPREYSYVAHFSENSKYNTIFEPSSYMYMKEEFSQEKKRKIKTGEVGVIYDHKVSQDSFSQMRTLYYEYQQNKFLLNAAYKKDSFDFTNKNATSSLSLAPEYKLSDNLSLKYVYSAMQNKQNTDFIFSLKPFKREDIYFDIGAGRVYYDDNTEPQSKLLFSTEFEF